MRRLIDSILFVLVAYMLTWPFVRGLFLESTATGVGAVALVSSDVGSGSIRVKVRRTADCSISMPASVAWSVHPDGPWIAGAVQSREGVATIDGVPRRDPVWLKVAVAGMVLPAVAVHEPADAEGMREALVTLPVGSTCFVGRIIDGDDAPIERIVVSIEASESADDIEVDCDADGRFFFASSRNTGHDEFVVTIANPRAPGTGRTIIVRGSGDDSLRDLGEFEL